MNNIILTKKHISQVKAGDTIIHNNRVQTLNNSNIKRGTFMGDTIWGDSYNLGYKPVIIVNYTKAK